MKLRLKVTLTVNGLSLKLIIPLNLIALKNRKMPQNFLGFSGQFNRQSFVNLRPTKHCSKSALEKLEKCVKYVQSTQSRK